MATRARQLADKPLKIVFGGVCREEVEAFVAEAAADYHAALAEVGRLRSELAEVTATLVSAHAEERETTRTISRAENDARAIREAAERQAVDLQRAAEVKAAALHHDLEVERERINRQIARCAESRARLARLLQTEIDELGLLITSRQELSAHTAPTQSRPAAGRTLDISATQTPARASAAASPMSTPAHGAVSAIASAHSPQELRRVTSPAIEELPVAITAKGVDEAWSAEDVESALRALIETSPPASEPEAAAETVSRFAATDTAPENDIRGIAADPRYAAAAEDAVDSSTIEGTIAKRSRVPRFALGAAAIASVVIVALVAFPRSGTDAATPTGRASATPAAPVHAAPATSTSPARSASIAVADAPLTPGAPSNKLVVRVQATRPCWIGVTIGDEKETRLLGQGEEITRESTSDLVLRVGDAGALVVNVNDRRLPPLGADGEVVTRRFSRNQ